MTKICSKCGEEKSLDEFSKRNNRPSGYHSACKVCCKKQNKKWRSTKEGKEYTVNYNRSEEQKKYMRDKARTEKEKTRRWAYKLRTQYNLTPGEHYQMWIDQNGCCAVCNKPVDYKKAHTDHNHITEKVRGLTCKKCNTGLGMFCSDEKGIKLLQKAIEYIRKHDART